MLKGAPAAFILELPTYKIPQASEVARQVWKNTSEFVKKAGTTIFCLSVILWAMTYYPRLPQAEKVNVEKGTRAELALVHYDMSNPSANPPGANPFNIYPPSLGLEPFASPETYEKAVDSKVEKAIDSAQLQHSIAGRFGHWLEPAIRPLGFDWKMGVGLVGAFAAREVFVSTMAITYAAGDEDDTQDLSKVMLADTYPNGKAVWTPLVAISLLNWFVLRRRTYELPDR